MTLKLEVRGDKEAQHWLAAWARLVASDKVWEPSLTATGEELRRYAVAISPVVTGSYQRAHQVSYRAMQAVMTIDPGATNRGIPVTSYADAVEARHQVYGRTFAASGGRAVVAGAEVLLERMQ